MIANIILKKELIKKYIKKKVKDYKKKEKKKKELASVHLGQAENFSLFLVLFMGPIALFGIIYRSHCTIQLIFTFIYNTFSKKILVSASFIYISTLIRRHTIFIFKRNLKSC